MTIEGPYAEIFNLAKPYLQTRQNEIHTRIAYSFALRLLQAEGGDEAVVLPAVILHDVGWKSVPEDLLLRAFGPGKIDWEINKIHEAEGARIARLILEEVHYDERLTEQIVEIIRGHDSREKALSLNDAIVKDADKLWRFSPQALEIDPKRFAVDALAHAEWLGLQIEKWFFTGTAGMLAREEQRLRVVALKKARESHRLPG